MGNDYEYECEYDKCDKINDTETIQYTVGDGNNVGDIYFDTATNTYSINTGSGSSIITASAGYNGSWSAINSAPTPALTLKDGTVKFGDFEIPVDHLEIILRQLYEDVKKNNPEHFI